MLLELQERGHQFIIWTMRSGETLQDACNWFTKNGISYIGANENPTQHGWSQSPKAYAQVYIDDAALGCPLRSGVNGPRPMVDWALVRTHMGLAFPTP